MSDLEAQYCTPLSGRPPLLFPTFSPWITIVAVVTQTVLCGLTWCFFAAIAIKIIALPDNLAIWTHDNPTKTNMLVTVISTVLAMIGSTLLGITVEHALTFRLPRGVRLSMVTPWIQLARNSLFLRPRRHLWWTLLSVLWVAVIHLLTTAWSNLLTPVTVVQNFAATGVELDLLSPATANYLLDSWNMPFVAPTNLSYSLTPDSLRFLASDTGYLSQAGIAAAMTSFSSGYPAFISQYNSSSGGANPTSVQYQLSNFPVLQENYQGLSTSYTLVQQGYTANISCSRSSSPAIALNNSASVDFETSSGSFNYTLGTWSWNTSCPGNAEYYTGEVNILTSDDPSNQGFIGNGLFATSVCFYQDFSGPSNQSFLVIMQSPSNSGYNTSYFGANPSLPVVCQITPMVTTVTMQYNQSGLSNVNNVFNQVILPNESWPLASIQAFVIWAAYFLSQGPYSNSFADDPLDVVAYVGYNGDIMPVLEQYLRGIFEYYGSVIRAVTTGSLQALPHNMTTPLSGIMNVQTMGWKLYPQTHYVAISLITIVALVTIASGISALSEVNYLEKISDTLPTGSTRVFNPTDLLDVLGASSVGSLANALSECRAEEDRDKVVVRLALSDQGLPVLNADGNVAVDVSEDGGYVYKG